MASINPQAAADLVQQVAKKISSRAALAVVGATSAPYTPVLVKMLLDLPADVDPQWRERKLNGQTFVWAALDPTAAAEFADQYQSTGPDLAAGGIVYGLAAADPAAAERWLKEHQYLSKQPAVMRNYLCGLYQNDPAGRSALFDRTRDRRSGAAQPAKGRSPHVPRLGGRRG